MSPDRLAKVEEAEFAIAALKLTEDAFRKVWDNSEDAEYDRL